jgi:hypothetical protein
MSRRRYERIPGTDLAVIHRVPNKPRPPRPRRHEIVSYTPRPPSFQITETSYHTINPGKEIQLTLLTAILNYLASRRR